MLTFPDRLRVSECAFTPSNQSVTGGAATSGFQQFLASPRGRWTAKLTCQVVGEEEVLAYQSFVAALQGSANLCVVGPRDGIRPRSGGFMLPWRKVVAWTNGAMWFNGAGWAAPARLDAALNADATQGATTLTIAVYNGRGPRPGNYVGVAGFLYRVLPQGFMPAPDNSHVVTVTVWPRLRVAAPADTPVELAAPTCPMRLARDDSGALSQRWREQATPTLEFVESFPVTS